jgi:uncharacterized damage-inducible protein DinB
MRIVVVLTTLIVVALGTAEDTTKKPTAPKPPLSRSQYLLENWNDIGRKLIAMAEDFPEDKYDFKPVPGVRSFAEQLLHAANANYFFTNPALGVKPPAEENPNRADFKSKAAVVAFVKKAFADGAAAIKQKGDKGMNDLAWSFIEHSGEHYGQLVVYYRVSGLVPPESRPKK